MKKIALLMLFCCIGILCLAGCGTGGSGESGETQAGEEKTTAETTVAAEELTPEEMNVQMVGTWLPAEGVENDTVAFGYRSDTEYNDDPSGQFCINVAYAKGEGGGSMPLEYEMKDGKLVYTTFLDEHYSAGGQIDEKWVIEPTNLSEGKAVINGVAYEKVTDDPSDSDQRAAKIVESRLKPIIAGEWEGFDGMVYIKLNEDGTMHYEDTSMSVDGTWRAWRGMMISITFTDPYSQEEGTSDYQYDIDEDTLEGRTMNTDKLVRK